MSSRISVPIAVVLSVAAAMGFQIGRAFPRPFAEKYHYDHEGSLLLRIDNAGGGVEALYLGRGWKPVVEGWSPVEPAHAQRAPK